MNVAKCYFMDIFKLLANKQGSHGSGKSKEKITFLKSQESQEILEFGQISGKSQEI